MLLKSCQIIHCLKSFFKAWKRFKQLVLLQESRTNVVWQIPASVEKSRVRTHADQQRVMGLNALQTFVESFLIGFANGHMKASAQ